MVNPGRDNNAAPLPRGLSRRTMMKTTATVLGSCMAPAAAAHALEQQPAGVPPPVPSMPGADVQCVVTTSAAPWQPGQAQVEALVPGRVNPELPDVIVDTRAPRQTVEGFGACFNELGWTSLSALPATERDGIMRELFAPGVGANFTMCRMPLGANDFSRDWYSYDEVAGDFALEHFSIANDLETLVPFIKAAQRHQPDLALWASPWSPPAWMKTNGHYATMRPRIGQVGAENGLRVDQVRPEGADTFILDDKYLRAYAAYFGRFIDEYRAQGIPIRMVMPQNEYNSPQVFPSCPWTAQGLARFIGVLGPEMEKRGVSIFLGTLERAREEFVELCLRDQGAGRFIKGVGCQWAGKGAVPYVSREMPHLPIYQTEQECGNGKNDWRYCRYAWTLVRHFFRHGASAYFYWNISLAKGGRSRWGWSQNSLVTVDVAARTFSYTHEYYLMKHLSHFVRPGARALDTTSWSGYENQVAFANPDGSVVIVMQNDMGEPMPVRVMVGGRILHSTLPADSFSTLVVPAGVMVPPRPA